MKYGVSGLMVGMALLAVAMVAGMGCETTETTETVITVSPGSATLHGGLATTNLTASVSENTTLALPLVWSVSNPALGNIQGSSGLTAVYTSTGRAGNNVVTVRDQGQAEGIATIVQR